jgi:hypothetical protein
MYLYKSQIKEGGIMIMINDTQQCKQVPKSTTTTTTKESKEYLDGLNTTSNPSYYKLGGIEPFAYMRSKMTSEEFQGYLKCNIIKYVSRMGHKINKHDDIDNQEDNRLLSVYDDACKIRKYADTLCKEIFKALPGNLQLKYAAEDEWLDINDKSFKLMMIDDDD